MDKNLLQATVTLATADLKPIPRATFLEFCRTNLANVEYPMAAIHLAEIFCATVVENYDDRKVCAYIGEYFTHAQDVFGHKFSTRELELVESFVSSVQAAYRNYDIFSNPDMLNRMKAQADLIDDCGDDAVFYFTYKVCSGILRCAIEHFPEEKALAYDIVGKMNKYQERYDGISFVGKDKCHG